MPQVKCKKCGKEFYTKPSQVKLGFGKYCSRTCQHKSRKTGKNVNCHICGKVTYKQLQYLNSTKIGKFFCSKSCQAVWRNTYFSGERHPNWKEGKHQDYRKRLLKISPKPICKKCGIDDKRVLVVHHVDMNRKHNEVENLIWLCLNCHFLVHRDKIK